VEVQISPLNPAQPSGTGEGRKAEIQQIDFGWASAKPASRQNPARAQLSTKGLHKKVSELKESVSHKQRQHPLPTWMNKA